MPSRRLKPNPGQKVWQTAEIRAEIARWLPIPSKARFMRVDKTSFDTFLPSVWRSVGPMGFLALKAQIWAAPSRHAVYLAAVRTFNLAGELPLLCSPPKDALYFFELIPNATRIQWTTGYAERPAGPGTQINLRVLLQAVIEGGIAFGLPLIRIEDPWEEFCARKAVLPNRSLAFRSGGMLEVFLDDRAYETILAAQPRELYVGDLWLTELGGLAAAISRRYPHGLPHPMLLINPGGISWSQIDVEIIVKLGQLGVRFELHVLLDAARAVLADCSRAAPYIDRLIISHLFNVSLTAVGGIRGRLHHPWNDIHDAWPPSQWNALPAINQSSSIRYLSVELVYEPDLPYIYDGISHTRGAHAQRLSTLADRMLAAGGRSCEYDLEVVSSLDWKLDAEELRRMRFTGDILRTALLRFIDDRLSETPQPVGWRKLKKTEAAGGASKK